METWHFCTLITVMPPNRFISLSSIALPTWENLKGNLFLLHYCYVFPGTLGNSDEWDLGNTEKSCWASLLIVWWTTLLSNCGRYISSLWQLPPHIKLIIYEASQRKGLFPCRMAVSKCEPFLWGQEALNKALGKQEVFVTTDHTSGKGLSQKLPQWGPNLWGSLSCLDLEARGLQCDICNKTEVKNAEICAG